ncbi:RidA family protein [Spirosoma sp.]|uniref:RidA family protein n=1 Tax=Spirosoma sp. TaxID=1899569 RepID=UPI003B3B9BB9
MKTLLIWLSWVLLTSCGKAQDKDTPTPILPSGYLYKVEPGIPGKATYVCGERPFNSKGELVAVGDLDGQTKQVFDNIKTSLATVNMTLKDVVQIKYLVRGTYTNVSADTVQRLNKVSAAYFSTPPQLIDMKSIAKIVRDDVLIEIEVIASN